MWRDGHNVKASAVILKHFRRVAIRHDELAANFLAMIQRASMRLWLQAYKSTA
jgi:transposase